MNRQLAIITVALAFFTPDVTADDGNDRQQLSSFLKSTCRSCHSGEDAAAQFLIPSMDDDVAGHLSAWEKVARRLQNGDMPPSGEPRPDPAMAQQALQILVSQLDQAAEQNPEPGRTSALRR